MLDLEVDHMYNTIGVSCTEELKKECFSLDTPKECNEMRLCQDIFNDPLFDLMDNPMCDCSDILLNMDEHNPEYKFQHSYSDDSSILSFPEQRSPAGSLNDYEIKFEMQTNQMQFQGLDNSVTYEMTGMNNYSKYSNYSKLPPIILQPILQAYNSIVSSPMDNCYNYPIMSNSSSLLNLPRDTIVYVPTPVRNLQSNMYYNSSFNMNKNQYSVESTSNFLTTSMNTPMISLSEMPNSLSIEELDPNMTFTEKYIKPKKVVQTEKTFACSTCEVKFTRRDELRRHEKIHSGEKPLSCPYCDKCFIRSDHRKTHIRTHTGEKPYACDICLKRFARSDEKLRHTKTHFRDRPRRRRRKKATDQPTIDDLMINNAIPENFNLYSNIQREQSSLYDELNQAQNYVPLNNDCPSETTYSPLFLEQLWNN